MKNIINIISYTLSVVFILMAVIGVVLIYSFVNENNNTNAVESLPTLNQILEDFDIPVVEMNGDTSGISKENKVNIIVNYYSDELSFNSKATLKWQGNSSLAYDKKNYTIKFVNDDGEDNDITIKSEWGAESKYCLKANYIDYTSSRNVVSAKLYGQVVHSRNITDELDQLVNGGAIDGFPVVIFMNNEYHGIYTFNTPKDKWIFDMNKNGYKAILMGDQWSASTKLMTTMASDIVSSGWDLEYCSTEKTEGTDWVVTSFNNLIDFVNQNDGESFKNGISNYVNIDRTIDTMLFTLAINGRDNLAKNIIWVTYDGTIWTPSAYDLDGTWGISWNGEVSDTSSWLTLQELKYGSANNILWKKILANFEEEVKVRYFDLRDTILSFENIVKEFSNFSSMIPTEFYKYDAIKYPGLPSQNLSNLSQIYYFAQEHLKKLDLEFTNI